MAGAGIRVFTAGEVLTAAQVNQYLMDQVITRFADAATRDASFGGEGQPVLTEGRFCYLDSTNTVQYYDGDSWNDASQFTVGEGSITTNKLADDAVTSDKIADGAITSAHIADGTVIATDIADGSVTSAKILDGTIVNGDISASAAIAHSKLANITAGNVLLGNSSNVPTSTAITGDVTIDSSGVTAISSGVIVNADINASAAIDKTKISGTAITAADTGTVTSTILSDRSVGSSELDNLTLNAQTGTTYTLALSDAHKLVTLSNASPITLTIPTNAVAAFEIGDQVNLLQLGAGQVTISGAGVTIRSEGSKLKIKGQYAIVTCVKIATDEWVVIGNLSA